MATIIRHKAARDVVLHTIKADTLVKANLRKADLRNADLARACLRLADLTDAELCNADLRGADLSGADLRGADLTGANLTGAALRNTLLGGANLTETRGIICLPYHDPRGYRPIAVWQGREWRIAAGCRWFLFADAIQHWGSSAYEGKRAIGKGYVAAIRTLPLRG